MSNASDTPQQFEQKTNGWELVEKHHDVLEEIIERDLPFAEGAKRLLEGLEKGRD